jgi:hypothetical protein
MKTLKQLKLTIATLILTMSGLVSCNNATELPFSFAGTENESPLNLIYPNDPSILSHLQGGDGNYSVECDRPDIVQANLISDITIQLQALSIGDATLTVRDGSGHTLQLQIHVDYEKFAVAVEKQDVIIQGNLTDTEKQAIREEAIRTIPVEVDGGYLFIYTNGRYNQGKAFLYPNRFGVGGIETTFEEQLIDETLYGEGWQTLQFGIDMDGKVREFHILRQPYDPSTRTSLITSTWSLAEDVTDRFKSQYPGVTLVYTTQELTGQ